MTIEQYGSGRHVVRVFYDGFRGTYRFETREEAEAFAATQRGWTPRRTVRITLSDSDHFTGDFAAERNG